MLKSLFPPVADNTLRGLSPALWLLWPVAIIKLVMGVNFSGLNPLISPEQILSEVDGVPLDTLGAEAARYIVSASAAWGLCLALLAASAIVILLRWRSLVPLASLLLLLEQGGRMTLNYVQAGEAPFAHGLSPAAMINWGLAGALALALVLSLIGRASEK